MYLQLYAEVIGPNFEVPGPNFFFNGSKSDPKQSSDGAEIECSEALSKLAALIKKTTVPRDIKPGLNAVAQSNCSREEVLHFKDFFADNWPIIDPKFKFIPAEGKPVVIEFGFRLPVCTRVFVCRYLPLLRRRPTVVFTLDRDGRVIESVLYENGQLNFVI